MEIQDKNNILQQMLGARMFNVSAPQSSENVFAEMLGSGKQEPAVSFEDAKRNVAVKSGKEPAKTEYAAKEDKKEKVSAKKNDNADNKPKEKVEDKKTADVQEEKAVAAQPQAETSSSSVQPENNAEVPAEGEDVTGVATEGDGAVVSAAPVVLPAESVVLTPVETVLAADIDAQTVVMPQNQEQVDMPFSVAEGGEQVVSAEDMTGQVQPEGEDALLLRQAEYLDKKINAGGKVKVEVAVQEEKIAAPIEGDVVQNRFEVDALLRKMTAGEKSAVQEEFGKQAEISNVAADKPVTGNVQPDSISGVQLNNAAVPQTTEEKAQVSIEASRLSASGKEMVVEASTAMRSESFVRVNETSTRDVFKGMGKEAVEQIKVNITKSAVKGVDTIDIQLKPEDLGKIQIKMHISKDGKVQAEIISGRQETLDMLQREASGLARAFEEAGYETDGKSFSFSFQEDNQAGRQSEDDSGLLKFIGDALEQEAESAAGNDNDVYNPARGLNIRV